MIIARSHMHQIITKGFLLFSEEKMIQYTSTRYEILFSGFVITYYSNDFQ